MMTNELSHVVGGATAPSCTCSHRCSVVGRTCRTIMSWVF